MLDLPIPATTVDVVLPQLVVPASIWIAALVLLALNFKSIPLMWHARLLNALRFVLRVTRTEHGPTTADIFRPMITTSRSPLMEIDFNIHKSNSTYFSDLDIARSHLMCTLFSAGIERIRGGQVFGKNFTFVLGAVSCTFRREIAPYETYEMWTRVLSWDAKWIYLVTHFVKRGSVRPRCYSLYPWQQCRGGERRGSSGLEKEEHHHRPHIFASAISKLVFKKGRLTIAPDAMLQLAGLLPQRPADLPSPPLDPSPSPRSSLSRDGSVSSGDTLIDSTATSPHLPPHDLAQKLAAFQAAADARLDDEAEAMGFAVREKADGEDSWSWDRVEQMRLRGMRLAQLLAGLDALEGEFVGEEAAGVHLDL